MSKAVNSFRTVYRSLIDDAVDDRAGVGDAGDAGDARATEDDAQHATRTLTIGARSTDASIISRRYDMGAMLGRGGMGQVWLCRDRHIGRDVAIKVVNARFGAHADARLRFLREARVQGRLEHPAIVPVYDLQHQDGNAYFAMKRVRGVTLATILEHKRRGDAEWAERYPLRKLLAALGSIALAVDFAHAKGVVHRDIKPGNIMLGDFGEVYLLDWGLAKIVGGDDGVDGVVGAEIDTLTDDDARDTAVGSMLGTPGFMAPEQIDTSIGAVDSRTDVYALGAVLFEVVALRPFIDAKRTVEATLATLHATEERRPSVATGGAVPTGAVDDICARALARNPDERFASARELHAALDRHLAGEDDLARRRELSRRHLDAARAGSAENARSQALRELGSALALDPYNVEARRALVGLLTSAPSTLPPEVAAKVEADDAERARSIARMRARRAALCWLPFVPFAFVLGVRSTSIFAVAAAALVVSTAVNVGLIHLRRRPAWLPYLSHITFFIAALNFSTIAGPFVFLPPLLLANSVEYQLHPQRVHRITAFVGAVVVFALAFALEITGVVGPSYAIVDGGIMIRSNMIDLGPGVLWFFFAGSAACIVAPSFLAGRARAVLAAAETRLHLHAWQLAQIVPPEG